MFEELNAHRLAVQENIEKAFEVGFTGNEDLEKAHQVGDIHPNGKWVWTQLPSGKYDWRVIKKQSQSTVPSQQNVNKQQKTEDGLTKEELEELRALESAARKGYKLLQRDANRLRRLQAKERELKQAKSTDDNQSDDKVKLTEGDFKKGVVEKDEYTRKNAIDLHDYTGKSIEYYTDNGEKKKAQPYISEFYDSAKQDAVGGYEAYFDRADSIGTFRTLKEAISALETWINNMRVKGHAKPKWIYNESGGRYQMNYRLK